MLPSPIRLLATALALAAGAAQAQAPATVRLDYTHSGNALSDQYAIERVLIEPLPWPGDLSQAFDNTNRGQNRVEVVDAKTGDMLYSRDFSTIFGEWRTTEEANKISRGFHESVQLCTKRPCCGVRPRPIRFFVPVGGIIEGLMQWPRLVGRPPFQ